MKPDFEKMAKAMISVANPQLRVTVAAALRAAYAAGLERAAEIAENYDGDGLDSTSHGDQLGNASKTMYDISAAIRAEKENEHD